MKTLKALEEYRHTHNGYAVDSSKLRAAAVEWVKGFEAPNKGIDDYGVLDEDGDPYRDKGEIIRWIVRFFNLSESDLK